jgi:hypothetical protein
MSSDPGMARTLDDREVKYPVRQLNSLFDREYDPVPQSPGNRVQSVGASGEQARDPAPEGGNPEEIRKIP